MKIMAPAGDKARLLAAIQAGADEVYMGIAGFGARRFATNFSVDEYCQSLDWAHRFDVSVNLTLNTILSDAELDSLEIPIRSLSEAGLDAVIVQDFGVARWLRARFPSLPLHASTQMSLTDSSELNLLERFGFNRAVLARELSFNEIESIRKSTPMELEVFASGALCLACSGKCYLSSFIGGRSGNRGMCAQPCRQQYETVTQPNQDHTQEYAFSDEGNHARYFLSLKDQWQETEEIERLMKIGVDSIKIEGRMKSPEYVYEAVSYYRRMIDHIHEKQGKTPPLRFFLKGETKSSVPDGFSRIRSLFNRGYAKGYLYEHDPDMLNLEYSSNYGVEIGRVTSEGHVRLSAPVRNGDGIVYLDADLKKISGLNVAWIDLIEPGSNRRHKVDAANRGDLVRFEYAAPSDSAYVYKTGDFALLRELNHRIEQIHRYSPIEMELTAKVGQPLTLTVKHTRGKITVSDATPLQRAQKKATTREDLESGLDRLGETPFYLKTCRLESDMDVFVPKSLLNQLRQQAVDQLAAQILESYRRSDSTIIPIKTEPAFSYSRKVPEEPEQLLTAVVRTPEQFEACRRFGLSNVCFLSHPVNFLKNNIVSNENGTPLAGSLYDAIQCENRGRAFDADWTFNVGNYQAVLLLSEMFPHLETIWLSPELSENACKKLLAHVSQQGTREKPLKFGLPVYGHLTAMWTRKTLFSDPLVRLVNQSNHPVIVVRNDLWYHDGKGMTGSTVYDGYELDLITDFARIRKLGFDRLRLDFTVETAAETMAILKRFSEPASGRSHSYGFERGIF